MTIKFLRWVTGIVATVLITFFGVSYALNTKSLKEDARTIKKDATGQTATNQMRATDWYYNGSISDDFFDVNNWSEVDAGGGCGNIVDRPCHLSAASQQDLQTMLEEYDGNTESLLTDAGRRAN